MEAIVINPSKEERKTILTVLKALKIPYGSISDETEYLLSTKANKDSLMKSLEQHKTHKTHQLILPKI